MKIHGMRIIEREDGDDLFELCREAEKLYRIFKMVHLENFPLMHRAVVRGFISNRFAISIEEASKTIK